MNTLLLCNVGTRDIELQDQEVLPADLINPKSGLPIPRITGEHLRQPAVFAQCKEQIQLPMVEKALRYIAPKEKTDLHLVLFATDQPATTEARFRNNDTLIYADLMRDVLFERYQREGLVKKRMRVVSTAHNPADYDLMYDFYHEELPRIRERTSDLDRVFLLIAGGTPQMNTMLLFVGSEVFEMLARPIYVSPGRDRARALDILRQMYGRALQRNLHTLLHAYAYPSALEIVEQEQEALHPWQVALLRAVFRYATARRNIDLETAAGAFDETFQTTRDLREAIDTLQQEVTDTSEQAKLQETIYLAQVAAETGTWLDFLTRLHRFSEGCMQVMAETLGVAWSTKERSSYKETWWDENRPLLHDLGLAAAEKPADAGQENRQREVHRGNLRPIVARLAEQQAQQAYLAALADLEVVDRPIPLRNRVVHDFTPLAEEEIEQKAQGSITDLLTHMRSAYRHAFGIPVPEEHPYRYINEVCARILRGAM